MSQGSKLLLGIATFLPLLLGVILVFEYLSILPGIVQTLSTIGEPSVIVPGLFARILSGPILVIIMLLIITKLSLMIYYIIHAVNHMPGNDKILWVILFVLAGSIPLIVYYFVKIVPSKPAGEVGTASID